jgi:hypothetical protein
MRSKIWSFLAASAALFLGLSAAHAAGTQPLNPQQCALPAACNDINRAIAAVNTNQLGAFALTTPANPSAVTPGTTNAVMLGLAAGTGPSVLTPTGTGRVHYSFTFSVLVGSITNGATFQCSHGTGTPPANAGALAGTQDSAAVAYLAGVATEKAVVTCSGTIQGLAVGTAAWFDVAVLNTTGSQAVTASVATFNAFEF